jgi:hypothetical protein
MFQLGEVADDGFTLLPADWTVGLARRFLSGLDYTHVIVQRAHPTYYYLYTSAEADAFLQGKPDDMLIFVALDLHEYRATETREIDTPAEDAPDRTVVLAKEEVVGFLDATAAPVSVRGPSPTTPWSLGAAAEFKAYPALDIPNRVAPGESFEAAVGFRPHPDVQAANSGAMVFHDPQPEDECLVVLITDGIDLDINYARLPIRMDVRYAFHCCARAIPGAAMIKAQFFYRNQLVGVTQRHLDVAADQRDGLAEVAQPVTLSPLSFPTPATAVDLAVTVTYTEDGVLQWTWSAPTPPIATLGPIHTRLQGAREFAAELLRDLKTQQFAGPFAANILQSKGQEIAALMPREFFEALRSVHAAIRRPPMLLLITNEVYVPWELALLDPPLDAEQPSSFLAAQTCMGRWLEDEQVMIPPAVAVEVRRATAVAAQYDPRTTGLRELQEAIAERATLEQRWQFIPLEARLADLRAVVCGAKTPGHLIHFAVHGLSDPTADNQILLLADRTFLPASALTGSYRYGEMPRFVFVFLNACQVGTAGTSFGQAAGFPGILIRRGVCGFVAPLWDVDDALARSLAERFYEATLTKKEPVGAVLQAERAAYNEESTTPIAYIYYGHPALRLNHVPA